MHQFDPRAIRAGSHSRYARWRYVAPLPSAELMGTVGAPDVENFLVVGDAWAQVVTRFAPPDGTVLDVGCGCGRTARVLLNSRALRYVGFDIMRPSIEWCRAELAPLSDGRFEFHHMDGRSAHYNPTGRLSPREIRFPCPDGSVDLAFGASLFTHLLEEDALHYLCETRRVLRRAGRALFSIHPPHGATAPYTGTEDRVEVAPAYFLELAARAGLALEEDLGELAGQAALLLRTAS